MPQLSPPQVAQVLFGGLQERDHNNILLHQQAAELAANGQLQPALRLLWSSIESAKRLNDDYVLGAARLHMAWAYFAAADEEEWNRGAELCEKAAYHFQQSQSKHEQGIAHLTRGFICEALCDKKQDRWTQSFRGYTDAYVLLRQTSEEFAENAREAYGRLGRKYVELGMAQEAESKAAETEAASAFTNPTGAAAKTETAPARAGGEQKSTETSSGTDGHTSAQSAADYARKSQPPQSPEPAKGVRVEPFPVSDTRQGATTDDSPGAPSGKVKSSDDSGDATNAETQTKTKQNPAENANTKPPFPLGLGSVRAVLDHGFSLWGWIAFAGVCVLLGLLFGLLALAFQMLWEREPVWMTYLGIGLLLGAALFVIPFVILAGAHQLFVRLQEHQAAIIIERKRVWALTEKGFHLLIPFHQDVVAFVPTAARPYANFKRNVVQWDTRWLSAHIEATYRVCAPDVFWDRVLYNLQRQKRLWVPSPLKLETVGDALDKHAETLIERSLILVTMNPDLRGLAANEHVLNDQIRELLSREAPADGIEFQNIEFTIMLSMSAQAP